MTQESDIKTNPVGNLAKNKLNLGCGSKIIPGAVNLDRSGHRAGVDVVHDLNILPWPFEAESFEHVIAHSVLEHLYHNILTSMDEIWRVLKPGGRASIKLPYWRHERTWEDSTHIHKAAPGILDQLDPTTKRGQEYKFYTPYKWKILKRHMNPGKSSIFWTLQKMPENWDGHE